MARPSRRTFTPTSVTSLRHLRGYSPQPARASALRNAAAVLLLAATVALPCTVLYRAAVDTTTPVYVPRARRPWLERRPTLPPVTTPEEDSAVDPVPPGDLVGFDSSASSSALHLATLWSSELFLVPGNFLVSLPVCRLLALRIARSTFLKCVVYLV
jgi:hypothetical protein